MVNLVDKQNNDNKVNLLVAQDIDTHVDDYEAKLRKEMGFS